MKMVHSRFRITNKSRDHHSAVASDDDSEWEIGEVVTSREESLQHGQPSQQDHHRRDARNLFRHEPGKQGSESLS